MKYIDFYNISEYGNEKWKGGFTPKEVACNAYDYLCEYRYSKTMNEPSHIIKELARLLSEDGSDKCKKWLYQIASELGLIDMDSHDYLETDEWMGDFL